MEWLKNKSLKRSFFIINMLFLCVGLLLSVLSFLLFSNLWNKIELSPRYEISLDQSGQIIPSNYEEIGAEQESGSQNAQMVLLNILQFILPVFFVILSLVLADITFYRLKLKKPLAILQSGVERIGHQNLDFEIEICSNDEIGSLCGAFEKMRGELLHSNRELWRQMEERKRLNAAFSHDLRNPVTVLKGSAKVLRKGLEQQTLTAENTGDSIDLIEQYTTRIETYIEAMTSAQKLEELTCTPSAVAWTTLCGTLENGLSLLGEGLVFTQHGAERELWADQYIVQNVAENLVANALRYAKTTVTVEIAHANGRLTLTVSDDGSGFSSAILKKGASPFLRDGKPDEQKHFGMGLYVCRLLCEKHDGSLALENTPKGAKVTASFCILKP
ncbi:MAG: HAMP domain-containing sensor histidine kinase [Lachnospiraceae bacterium]|nr:HAMP domain-containing sensor histidine kinase [Lachnospiraceae bacterium]